MSYFTKKNVVEKLNSQCGHIKPTSPVTKLTANFRTFTKEIIILT